MAALVNRVFRAKHMNLLDSYDVFIIRKIDNKPIEGEENCHRISIEVYNSDRLTGNYDGDLCFTEPFTIDTDNFMQNETETRYWSDVEKGRDVKEPIIKNANGNLMPGIRQIGLLTLDVEGKKHVYYLSAAFGVVRPRNLSAAFGVVRPRNITTTHPKLFPTKLNNTKLFGKGGRRTRKRVKKAKRTHKSRRLGVRT